MKGSNFFVGLVFLIGSAFVAHADTSKAEVNLKQTESNEDTKNVPARSYFPVPIEPYHPNYFMPFYYTASPYQAYYDGNAPDGQRIAQQEIQFQLSLKVPVIRHLVWQNLSLYVAYTQLSFWQAYSESAFFRETNYEPEVFLQYQWEKSLSPHWRLKTLQVGAMHQSNGRGGELERSWNRAYVKALFAAGDSFQLYVMPWYVLHDKAYERYDPQMAHYLGHGQLGLIYKWNGLVTTLTSRNNFESGFSRGAEIFTASYPVFHNFRVYVQLFSGYGQSLAEYNHYTNGFGIGLALNDKATLLH